VHKKRTELIPAQDHIHHFGDFIADIGNEFVVDRTQSTRDHAIDLCVYGGTCTSFNQMRSYFVIYTPHRIAVHH
jgi:hypothetical protein